MNKRFNVPKKVIVGGTFDMLHAGHKALLRKAFKLGEVTIGLTSDAMARKRERRKLEDFKHRKKELEDFIAKEIEEDKSSSLPFAVAREGEETSSLLPPRSAREFKVGFKIVKIEDKFGPTLKEDFDYIVVSPATYPTATLINKARQKRNKKPIKIVKIEFVLAEDGKPISTTRILKGEIDRQGKLLK